jgi:predicted alpha/beta-fold hydrolase
MAAKFFRRNETLNTISQTLRLDDGDFLELAWTEPPELSPAEQPLVVLLHGLEGSVNSHYAKGMLKAVQANGWLGVLMHFRGCGSKPNRMARSYHSGDTSDFSWLTAWLRKQFPDKKMAAIGFSLGGNVLAKYLATTPNNPYQANAIICAPLHLASCSNRINQGLSKIYQRYLVDMLRDSTAKKIQHKLIDFINRQQLNKIKTMYEFDQRVTAPLNGFNDADDYYQQSSSQFVLNHIAQAALFIHAKDDPFLCHQSITQLTQLPKNILFEVSSKGGHVGFISGTNPFKPSYYLEQRVPAYLSEFL